MGADLWTGVILAAMVGSLLHCIPCLRYPLIVPACYRHRNHPLASSLSYYIYRLVLPEVTSPPRIEAFTNYPIPLLSEILDWEALFNQSPLTYLAFILVIVVGLVLYRLLGLAVRTTGENPSAVEAQGMNVIGIRTGAVMFGSALMAIAGAFSPCQHSMRFSSTWSTEEADLHRMVVFASWHPGKALFGALLLPLLTLIRCVCSRSSVLPSPIRSSSCFPTC